VNDVRLLDGQIKVLEKLREDICKSFNKSISRLTKLRAKALEEEIKNEPKQK